ncbi:hypothetical protein EB118_14730 [bacterium]|nr:hypothetical protein [bacterium]NDC95231.1 hypothetical protein [bacterium]NDD84982.1 hypothetical protein [bacterium]NDG31312.1 hypothetical protein [bacterium]
MRLEKCVSELGRRVYKCTLKNTEQLGVYVERGICNLAKVPFNTVRTYPMTPKYLLDDIRYALSEYLSEIGIICHTGHKNGSCDFQTHSEKTVSVKTIMNSNNKICPQKVGQCTVKRFDEHFEVTQKGDTQGKPSRDVLKGYISKNLEKLVDEYLDNTFCCDHTILVHFGKGVCYCIDKYGRLSFSRGLKFSLKNIEWNESNTVYVKTPLCSKMTLGEFQIHNNRDSVKFRFNTNTLLKLITDRHIRGTKYTSTYLEHSYDITTKRNIRDGQIGKK